MRIPQLVECMVNRIGAAVKIKGFKWNRSHSSMLNAGVALIHLSSIKMDV